MPDNLPGPTPLPAPARMETSQKETPITAEVVPETASSAPPVTIHENETAMHENPTDLWTSLAGNSRRAQGFARQAPCRAMEDAVRNRMAVLGDEMIDDGQVATSLARYRELRRLPIVTSNDLFCWRG
jgi:hypothetical protein